jgi:hypothetical protein
MRAAAPRLLRLLFVAGMGVLAALEWSLRYVNLYQPVNTRVCSVFRLIPRAVRGAVVSLASLSFGYFLAQFLALLSLFLLSAFVQLTLKVGGCSAVVVARSPATRSRPVHQRQPFAC